MAKDKKENKTRQKADENISKGAVITGSVDLATLKRMYPKRFISDIEENEGYEKVSFNKWKKKYE